MTEINYSALKRSSRIAALLTAISSIVVISSLIIGYRQNLHARDELASIEKQTATRKLELARLTEQIAQLTAKAQAYGTVLNQVVSTNKEAAQTLARSAESSPAIAQSIPRVFVHARQRDGLEIAARVAIQLRRLGYTVPAPDILSNAYDPTKAEVVFFQENSETQSDLQQIKSALLSAGVPPEAVAGQQDLYNKRHPVRTYAVYLPSNASQTSPQVASEDLRALTDRELAARAEDLADKIGSRMHACFALRDIEGSKYNAVEQAELHGSPEQQNVANEAYQHSQEAVAAYVSRTRSEFESQLMAYMTEFRRRLGAQVSQFNDPLSLNPKNPLDCNYPTHLGDGLRPFARLLIQKY